MNRLLTISSAHSHPLLEVLIAVTLLFALLALLFYILTLAKRSLRIRKKQKKSHYQSIVDKILFDYMFNNESTELFSLAPYEEHFASNHLFQKVAIKSIISLHHGYSGLYQEKLEKFYVKSLLVHYSLRKLQSKKWYHKVEGIRDLANLKYEAAFDSIKIHLAHKNEMVQTESLIAMIKMRGLDELTRQVDLKLYLNEWTQSNILFTIKSNRINDNGQLEVLLTSSNPSIQLLAVRLMNHYGNRVYLRSLILLERETREEHLKREIIETIIRMHRE